MSKDYAGGARSGAEGNMRLLKDYGGHSNGSGTEKCYASGGKVHSDEAADKKMMHKTLKPSAFKADGGEVDGMSAKPRMDRPGRKMKGKGKSDKKGGTNVNVIIMPKGPDGAIGPAGPMPPVAMAGPPPMPPKPPGPPMGGPPMAGGPPMPPMRKDGGAVSAYRHGGKVMKKANGGHIHADGQSSPTEAEAEKAVEGRAMGGKVGKLIAEGQTSPAESEAEHAKKNGGKICRASGGSVKMDAGAGGGEGRLEKIKAYGK